MERKLTPGEIIVLFKILTRIVNSYHFDYDLYMFADTNCNFVVDFYKDEFETLKSLLSDIS
ncbi:unnamed protein product [marine sediment metagenome]|uniref:Uncharacterized protein n=1 Tax=marine sediment metagenome TaxID=412755 RepID=X1MVP1_9ZZZZ